MRIVVSEFMDEAALEAFPAAWSVDYDPGLVDDRPRLLAAVGGADALIVRNRTLVDEALLAAAPRLRAVGRLGVGLDNIDMAVCAARGVSVRPATGANTLSVAEYVIGAALALTRGAFFSGAAMRAGDWPRGRLGAGGEISGRTMGLFGCGAIARAVGERARALGMRVIGHDSYLPPDSPAWRTIDRVAQLDLLRGSDVLSLHAPLTDETRNVIDAMAIDAMKPGAILINTARGGLVEEATLAAALREGRLGGAALDVFETEPLTAEAAAKFTGLPNVILTPHVAGVTAEANARVSALTVANVIEALEAK